MAMIEQTQTARDEDSPLLAALGVAGLAAWGWGVLMLWAAFAPQGVTQ